jgi:hypothetical protein
MTRVSTSTQCWRGSSTLFFLVIIQDSDCNPVRVDEELPVASYIKQSVLEFVFWGVYERSIRLLRVVSSLMIVFGTRQMMPLWQVVSWRDSNYQEQRHFRLTPTLLYMQCHVPVCIGFYERNASSFEIFLCVASFVSCPWRLVRFGWIMSCHTSLVTMDCFSYIGSRQFISWPFLPLVPWPACIAASFS